MYIFIVEQLGLIQEDSLTHVDHQRNLESIYIQSHVKLQSPMTTVGALIEKENCNDKFEHEQSEQYSPSTVGALIEKEVFNDKFEQENSEQFSPSTMGTFVEKETFDDKFEHEKNEQYSPSIDCPNTENFNDKFEYEKSEQYSPSIDCPNTWRSAFIILSFIFATLLACMKFVNGISLSSIVQLKAGIRAEEVASNKKFVTLQRQTDVLLNEYFLDLEKEKAKNSTLSGQLATRDDVILSSGRSLELLNQENESQLSQLFDDNARLNSRTVELEDLNRKGSDLIDLANENKLQLHELINDKTILSKRIVELEGLNQQKHAMHVMIENQMKEEKVTCTHRDSSYGAFACVYIRTYMHIHINTYVYIIMFIYTYRDSS
jgi:hypothetical protein